VSVVIAVLLWMAFWLFAVNWKKLWTELAAGAWLPVVLLGLMAATVWSRIAPGPCSRLGFVTLPNMLWQLGAVAGLIGLALFSGWLQGQWGYLPHEMSVEPPPAGHGHHHGHGHGHH
jgi:hypothetical protein